MSRTIRVDDEVYAELLKVKKKLPPKGKRLPSMSDAVRAVHKKGSHT